MAYVPDAGDLVWMHFNPQAGHEQAGHRPALVLTPARYNALRGMMICCPMTSPIKNCPFEVIVSHDPPTAVSLIRLRVLTGARARLRAKAMSMPMF